MPGSATVTNSPGAEQERAWTREEEQCLDEFEKGFPATLPAVPGDAKVAGKGYTTGIVSTGALAGKSHSS